MVLNLHGEVPSDAHKVKTTQFGEYEVRKAHQKNRTSQSSMPKFTSSNISVNSPPLSPSFVSFSSMLPPLLRSRLLLPSLPTSPVVSLLTISILPSTRSLHNPTTFASLLLRSPRIEKPSKTPSRAGTRNSSWAVIVPPTPCPTRPLL